MSKLHSSSTCAPLTPISVMSSVKTPGSDSIVHQPSILTALSGDKTTTLHRDAVVSNINKRINLVYLVLWFTSQTKVPTKHNGVCMYSSFSFFHSYKPYILNPIFIINPKPRAFLNRTLCVFRLCDFACLSQHVCFGNGTIFWQRHAYNRYKGSKGRLFEL